MKEHIYVLGSNSFSGAYFVKRALAEGFRVTGISRSPEYPLLFLPYLNADGTRPHKFTFFQADINRDLEQIIIRLKLDKPAYIVNFAAQGMVAESWHNPEQWFHTNTVSPIMLCSGLCNCSWLKKFVQISTPEVYGSTPGAIRENHYYKPSTPYAVSKAATDMNLTCFLQEYNFPVVFTRAANVFGPCQQLYRIVPRAALRFLTGNILELHGGGLSIRSFIHVRDMAEATLQVMLEGMPGEIFHIATKRTISIRELVYLVARASSVDPEQYIRIVQDRPGKDAAYLLDSSFIREKLRWADRISLEQGVDEVVCWVKDNLTLLSAYPQEYLHKR